MFTGKAPFYGVLPTTVAVGILSGNRPSRPTHPDVTNDLWRIVERCWDQDPQRRPDVSDVILCLRNVIDLRCNLADVNDDETEEDATSESLQQGGPLIRESAFRFFKILHRERLKGLSPQPSNWTPYSSSVGRFFGFGRFPPEPRHQYSSSGAPQGKGFRFPGCQAFRTPQTNNNQSEKSKDNPRTCLPNPIVTFSQDWPQFTTVRH